MVYLFYNKTIKEDFIDFIEESNLDNSYALIIGGDGSLLRALKQFKYGEVPKILAFNKGTVGFLLPLNLEEMGEILNQVKTNKMKFIKRTRLYEKTRNALVANEIVIRSRAFRLNRFKIEIDGFSFNLRASELVIATETGSTGYNASLMGPIVFGNNIVINSTGPNRCNFRPIVLPNSCTIKIEAKNCIGIFDGEERQGEDFEIIKGDDYEVLVDEDYTHFSKIPEIMYRTCK